MYVIILVKGKIIKINFFFCFYFCIQVNPYRCVLMLWICFMLILLLPCFIYFFSLISLFNCLFYDYLIYKKYFSLLLISSLCLLLSLHHFTRSYFIIDTFCVLWYVLKVFFFWRWNIIINLFFFYYFL